MKGHWRMKTLILSAFLVGCASAPTLDQAPSAQGHSVRSALAAQVSPAQGPADPAAVPGLDGQVALHILARYRDAFKPSPPSGHAAGVNPRGGVPSDAR